MQLVNIIIIRGRTGRDSMTFLVPSWRVSSISPSRMLSSPTVMVESLSIAPISAVVSTTPRRQLVGQTKIWWPSGTRVPMWTMFQTPRAGEE